MYRWQGKIAVVTGASAGIGLAVVKAFLQKGLIVIGLSRRKQEMEMHMKDVDQNKNFHAIKCDVTKEQEVIDVFQQIKKDFGTTQILVNNAGLTTCGSLYETSRKDWETVFNTNVMGTLECSKQAILGMKEANVEGHIVNMNSVQGHRVYDYRPLHVNVYAATKHAITAITTILINDLQGSKIRVTSISPGLTDTKLVEVLGPIERLAHLQPADVADSIIYAVGTPPHVQITELTIKPLGEKFKYREI